MKVKSLQLNQVGRRFDRHVALRHVSVAFRAGEIVALLGPNGAGKTTLLRCLSTLLLPSRGQIVASVEDQGRVSDVDFLALAKLRRDFIGLVSHASLLYDDLTGRENLELFANLYNLTQKETEERVRSLLARVNLVEAGERQVSTYSRGMRQRLSIARALLQHPSLILLDEPFTGLDQSGRKIVYEMLEGLREEGCIVLMVTHHLTLPPGLVDRAILLKNGMLLKDGNPGEEVLASWYEHALAEVES